MDIFVISMRIRIKVILTASFISIVTSQGDRPDNFNSVPLEKYQPGEKYYANHERFQESDIDSQTNVEEARERNYEPKRKSVASNDPSYERTHFEDSEGYQQHPSEIPGWQIPKVIRVESSDNVQESHYSDPSETEDAERFYPEDSHYPSISRQQSVFSNSAGNPLQYVSQDDSNIRRRPSRPNRNRKLTPSDFFGSGLEPNLRPTANDHDSGDQQNDRWPALPVNSRGRSRARQPDPDASQWVDPSERPGLSESKSWPPQQQSGNSWESSDKGNGRRGGVDQRDRRKERQRQQLQRQQRERDQQRQPQQQQQQQQPQQYPVVAPIPVPGFPGSAVFKAIPGLTTIPGLDAFNYLVATLIPQAMQPANQLLSGSLSRVFPQGDRTQNLAAKVFQGIAPSSVDNIRVESMMGRWFQVINSPHVIREACTVSHYGALTNNSYSATFTILKFYREGNPHGPPRFSLGYGFKGNENGTFVVHNSNSPDSEPYWVVKVGPLNKVNQYEYAVISNWVKFPVVVLARDPEKFTQYFMRDVLRYLEDRQYINVMTKALNLISPVDYSQCQYTPTFSAGF